MFKKFPPENPCWTMLEEVEQPKTPNERVAEDKSVHPPDIKQIIHSLNLQAHRDSPPLYSR